MKNKRTLTRVSLILIIITMTICNSGLAYSLANSKKQIVFIIKPEDESQKRQEFLEKANKDIAEVKKLTVISKGW